MTKISGRPPKQFNIYVFNLMLNANSSENVMMKMFDMSRGTFYRYKKKYYVPVDFKLEITESKANRQKQLFSKYAVSIATKYSLRLWKESGRDDFIQNSLTVMWELLHKRDVEKHFIAFCNRVCELVLKKTIEQMARDKKTLLYYEDYYFDDNSGQNALDSIMAEKILDEFI